ncbi:uncharacterized protein [Linepithema humile]|uniref:uncharacterized protein n=1 Tax=Linepithema humile TaxID=83485 RepID=UPI00351F3494
MICLESQYFNFNKILLLAIGLWPYQQSKLTRLRFIFFCCILTSAIVFQFTIFLTSKCTPDLVIKVLSTTLFFAVFMISYIFFGINIKIMKDLLTQLQYIYNELKDENEYAILEKYGYNAKCYTIVLTTMGTCGIIVIIISQFWSRFLDVILPTNKSRIHNMQFVTEYFVDQERYYFLILFHISTALFIGLIAMLATGTMLHAYIQYTCGMFKIASYRIERTMRVNMLERSSLNNMNLIYDGIICAVTVHRQAMKLSELLISRFETMLLCITGSLVLLMSVNLFRISQIMLSKNNLMEFLLPCMSVATSTLYMFLANHAAQAVTDHNNHVFVTAYNVQWYIAPLQIQKIILFLLQKGAKDYILNVGGIFDASLECFATLVKASVSYFTVMHSTRKLSNYISKGYQNTSVSDPTTGEKIYLIDLCIKERINVLFSNFSRSLSPEQRRKMIRLENQYFHVSRILLLIIGLWPYQQSKLTRLWFIFLCSIQMTAIFFQFTIFLTSKCTFDLVIKVLSVTTILALSMATYVSFSTNTKVMKDFIAQLQYVYNALKDENEHAIIEKYDHNAKFLLIVLLVMGFCGFIGFFITQCWPRFFDMVLPMNKSRPLNILFVTEYFVDQERYIVLILLHMNAALAIGVAGLIAIGTILFTYIQHTCAMFRIASYRLERIINISILENNSLKRKNVICNNIISAVDIHRQAMKLSELLIYRFETMLLCLIIGLVVLVSLNLFRISQIMLSKNDIMELLPFLSVIISIVSMFVGHNTAQMIIDHNSHVFVTAYNIQWYITPLYIQKMILFLLQKGTKDFTLTIGGIFVGSLECFATLIKASISYFTVMYSIR